MENKNISLVNKSAILPCLEYLLRHKLCSHSEIEQRGLSWSDLSNESVQWAPSRPWWELLHQSAHKHQIYDLGFKMAFENKAFIMPLLTSITASNKSLIDALNYLVSQVNYLSTGAIVFLEKSKHGVWFLARNFEPYPQTALDIIEQHSLGELFKFLKHYLGDTWQPSAIRVRHEDSRNVFNQYFKHACLLDKNAFAGFFIDAKYLPENYIVVNQSVEQKLNTISDISFKDRIFHILYIRKKVSLMVLTSLEQAFNLTAKQIKSRLKKDGTCFRDVANDVKYNLAVYELTHSKLSLAQIAEDLGYKNQGHFTRAFINWSGVTPSQYIKEKVGKGVSH
ncbi:helix-turn-helix transcriptional regulator [Thalassotalea psychrophila]|uniref:Helix-turn-helix transcriptional regulator n=1 Tax=Thalassotalea psychrophila TaxID=3065647 RepID=A0ABY9TYU4_9GAMM|nr:helix-turn-helix transcriptional regulator [Colwelliaceae bacterium SQ149]